MHAHGGLQRRPDMQVIAAQFDCCFLGQAAAMVRLCSTPVARASLLTLLQTASAMACGLLGRGQRQPIVQPRLR